MSTSLPGPLRLVPEGPRCTPLSRATRTVARGPAVSTISTGRLGLWSAVPLLTSCPRRLGPMPEAPRGEPDFPGDFGQAPSACGVDQMSRVSRARFRGPAVSTGCPGPLGTVYEVSRVRPDVSGNQDQGPWALGVDLLSRALGSGSKGPRVRPAVLCVSGLCPSARGVHQLSRATRTVPEDSGVEQLPLVTQA